MIVDGFTAIDKEAFDALVASGPVADDDTVAASQWASKVKAAGKLVIATSPDFPPFEELNADGSVTVPEVLRRYMGIDVIK